MREDMYLRTPINRTAALVVNQQDCKEDESLSLSQERDCIVLRLKQIQIELAGLPKKHRYRVSLGQEKCGLQSQVCEINKKLKKLRIRLQNDDIGEWIIKVCKSKFNPIQWDRILHEAQQQKINSNKE